MPQKNHKARTPSEHKEQAAFFRWAHFMVSTRKIPELRLAHANPNAAKRSHRLANRMKAEGLKAGVPDVFIPIPRRGYHGFYIEFKRVNGVPSDVSDEQKRWLYELSEQGFLAVVAFGNDEAQFLTAWYFS